MPVVISPTCSAVRILVVILLGAVVACHGPGPKPTLPRNAIFRIADDDAKSLDPQTISDLASLRIAADQFEGVTRLNAVGEAEPGLASRWDKSADGLTWTFTLRPDMRFSDGRPINAALFETVFVRLHAPKTGSPALPLFEAIKTVRAETADRLRVELGHPFPALAELLAHPAMAALPLHRPAWQSDRPMITSGAYHLTEWVLGDHITLARNPSWHDPPAPVATIIWRPISDSLTSLRIFQAGRADTVADIPSARVARLQRSLGGAVRLAPFRGSYYFAFNTRRPPFSDVRIRKALSLAAEREWIARTLLGNGTLPAWGVIPPKLSGLADYRPSWASQPRSQRLMAAGTLLREAGYGPAHPLRFDIRFNSDADHRRIAVALAAMWRPLGVDAHLLNSEASLHFASLRRGDFALARSGWIGDLSAPENFLGVHLSNAGAINYSGHANDIYDGLLAAALAEPDARSRAQKMRRAEAQLIEDAAILPIYYYVSKSLVNRRIGGWRDNPGNIHPSRTLWIRQ
jgi:oligopeptide transport system substrate-binding protein